MKIENLVLNCLIEKNLIKEDSGEYASNSIKIDNEREIIISGNKLGLIELANYMINVALSDVNGSHIHLDQDNFFDDSNYEMIIVKNK